MEERKWLLYIPFLSCTVPTLLPKESISLAQQEWENKSQVKIFLWWQKDGKKRKKDKDLRQLGRIHGKLQWQVFLYSSSAASGKMQILVFGHRVALQSCDTDLLLTRPHLMRLGTQVVRNAPTSADCTISAKEVQLAWKCQTVNISRRKYTIERVCLSFKISFLSQHWRVETLSISRLQLETIECLVPLQPNLAALDKCWNLSRLSGVRGVYGEGVALANSDPKLPRDDWMLILRLNPFSLAS